MTLSDFASLSTAISGIAVTASLIYLALQVHQNTKHARALVHQGRATRVVELQMALANPELYAAVIAANGEELSPQTLQRGQFTCIVRAFLASWEDGFSQHRSGLLGEGAFLMMRSAIVGVLKRPGYRSEWERQKTPGTEFTKFMDSLLTTPALTTPASAASVTTITATPS